MSAAETGRRGLEQAVRALEQRGATVRRATTGAGSRNLLRVRLPSGDHVEVYVKSRGAGTWQTDVGKGSPTPESPDDDRFWLFVDLTPTQPVFYVAPAWWVENDIHETWQADLARFGGTRRGALRARITGSPKRESANGASAGTSSGCSRERRGRRGHCGPAPARALPRAWRGRPPPRAGPRRLGARGRRGARPALRVQLRVGRFGHLASRAGGGDDPGMLWRGREPVCEPPISREEVLEIIEALSDIKAWTWDILAILGGEDEDEL